MPTRCAIYARISDDATGEAAGVERQKQDATRQAERRGWTITHTLVDNDVSASRYARKKRPAYAQLLELIETGQVDAISVWHTDRLYRQPKELEHLIDVVEKTGLLVATCEGEIDLGAGDGRAMARVGTAFAAKESDDKSRRIKRKHEEIAKNGGYSGGKRPFGYERDGKTIREDEADLIRDAARRVLAGESTMGICREWDEAGISTVMGGPWLPTTLRRMLLTPRLMGMRTHHGTLTPAVWPAIIDRPTHQRLTAVLTDPARHGTNRAPARTYLLTGVVYCARCDVPMAPHSGRYSCERDYHGGCNGCGINAARLEADIVAAVLAVARSPKVRRQTQAPKDETRMLDAIAGCEAELSLIANDYAAGKVGRAGYLAAVGALEQRLERERAELSRYLSQAQVVTLAVDTEETWEKMSFDRRRATVKALIERIHVQPSTRQRAFYDNDRFAITWH